MGVRSNKNKGTTLIEVLVSIAIFSIISIPLSMTVISAIENNKKSENKQYAVVVAQQIIEQLRADETTVPNSVPIRGTSYNLTFSPMTTSSTGHDLGRVASNVNVGNGFIANVTFERKLAYEIQTSNGVNYDFSIIMDKGAGTSNTTNITGDTTYSNLMHDLKISNMADHTIQIKDNDTNNVLATYIPTDGLVDNIKISYLPEYGPHKIYFENNAATSLSVYIFKQNNENGNSCINSSGSIKFYDNLSNETINGNVTNGIYDIGIEIYKGARKVYSTETSISLGI